MVDEKGLLKRAYEARKKAYCPYSGFAVGAALLAKNGTVYEGCNIENASYGASNCAERTALFKAVSEGVQEFTAIAVVGGKQNLEEGQLKACPPCGICTQVLSEFCSSDLLIITGESSEEYQRSLLADYLPKAFKKDNL